MAPDPEITSEQLHALASAPLLSVEQEIALATRSLAGDVTARNALVAANVRLGIKLAAMYRGRGLSFADLIQESTIGLMTAAERFDPARGFRFSTYASHWVRQALGKAVADKARTIRLPIPVNKDAYRVKRIDRTLQSELGHEPTLEEVAHAAGHTVERLTEILPRTREPRSLEEPIGIDGEELGSFMSSPFDLSPADQYERAETAADIHAAVQRLPDRERRILTLRFGLDGDDGMTLDAVGEVFDLTRERIRQIEAIALERLHALMERTTRRGLRRKRAEKPVRGPHPPPRPLPKPPKPRPIDVLPEAIVGQCGMCGVTIVVRVGEGFPEEHHCAARKTA